MARPALWIVSQGGCLNICQLWQNVSGLELWWHYILGANETFWSPRSLQQTEIKGCLISNVSVFNFLLSMHFIIRILSLFFPHMGGFLMIGVFGELQPSILWRFRAGLRNSHTGLKCLWFHLDSWHDTHKLLSADFRLKSRILGQHLKDLILYQECSKYLLSVSITAYRTKDYDRPLERCEYRRQLFCNICKRMLMGLFLLHWNWCVGSQVKTEKW